MTTVITWLPLEGPGAPAKGSGLGCGTRKRAQKVWLLILICCCTLTGKATWVRGISSVRREGFLWSLQAERVCLRPPPEQMVLPVPVKKGQHEAWSQGPQ